MFDCVRPKNIKLTRATATSPFFAPRQKVTAFGAELRLDSNSQKAVTFAFQRLALLLGYLLLVACGANDIAPFEPPTIHFVNVASEVGLDFQHSAFRWGMSGDPVAMMGGGLCWLDYDADGWLDLYVVDSYALDEAGKWQAASGLPTGRLYKNNEGMFADVSAETQTNISMRGNGCIAADLDIDGDTDLYITTSRFNFLLWNNGDGTFSEGAKAAGVDAYGWQTASVVGDLNADGWPDLFVAGYVNINNKIEGATQGFPNTHYGMRDLLYLSNGRQADGSVTFREVGELVGLETENFEYGLGAVLTDADADGDLDLFVANDTNPNRMYLNEPVASDPDNLGFRLVEVGADVAVDDTNSGMGVAGGDYDNDGLADLFITNMGAQLHSVYRNISAETQPQFSDAINDIGIDALGADWTGWGTNWADFDHDGDLDLLIAHGAIPVLDLEVDKQVAHLYLNQTAQGQAGQFVDGTTVVGLDAVGAIIGRGSATADFDNDGDLDVVIGTIGGDLALLRNDVDADKGNWLQVHLPNAVNGATVTAQLTDGSTLVREMHIGSSYLASEDPRCHFGLGNAQSIAQLIIRHSDGTQQVLEDVAVNQVLTVGRE